MNREKLDAMAKPRSKEAIAKAEERKKSRMLTEDYCSFEVCELLKEKGFNEKCRTWWDNAPDLGVRTLMYSVNEFNCSEHNKNDILAPTHQMAMKWLREKYIYLCPVPAYFSCDRTLSWDCDIWADDNYEESIRDKETYESAVESALRYSLENLI